MDAGQAAADALAVHDDVTPRQGARDRAQAEVAGTGRSRAGLVVQCEREQAEDEQQEERDEAHLPDVGSGRRLS